MKQPTRGRVSLRDCSPHPWATLTMGQDNSLIHNAPLAELGSGVRIGHSVLGAARLKCQGTQQGMCHLILCARDSVASWLPSHPREATQGQPPPKQETRLVFCRLCLCHQEVKSARGYPVGHSGL